MMRMLCKNFSCVMVHHQILLQMLFPLIPISKHGLTLSIKCNVQIQIAATIISIDSWTGADIILTYFARDF